MQALAPATVYLEPELRRASDVINLRVGQEVEIHVSHFIRDAKGLMTCDMTGTIKAVSAKAILFAGSASVRKSRTCHNCGREIINPISILVGYGPICSDNLGIPRPEKLSPDEIDAIRARVTRETRIEAWFPRSSTFIRVLAEPTAVAPTVTPSTSSGAPTAVTPTVVAPTPRLAARIICEADGIKVFSEWEHKDRCKGVPGARWDATKKCWRYPTSTSTARNIAAAFRGLHVDLDPAFTRLLAEGDVARAAIVHKTADVLDDVPNSKTSAWLHQRRAYHFAVKQRAAMLAMGMGTGKSKVAVDLIVNKAALTTLIVCPRSVVGVWPKQFHLHAGRAVDVVALRKLDKHGRATATGYTVAEKTKIAQAAVAKARKTGTPVVVVINYESARLEPFCDFALKETWDMVVLDESHKIKSPSGAASIFCGKLGSRATNRLCLTGTPQPHSVLDVYAQYRFLDPGVYGTSYVRFRDRYAEMGGYGDYEIVGYKNTEELNEKFYSLAYRVGSDVLDLPPVQHIDLEFELDGAAAKTYRTLEDGFFADVESGEVTVSNALVRLLRLQQITSGYVRADDGSDVAVDDGKEKLLADTLDNLAVREPVVVFCRFQHDLDAVERVAKEQGRRYGELSGRRHDLTVDSTMPEDVDVLGVQIQAGGVGIDLTRASYAIYYSLGFSLGDYDQSLARIHRPGQTRPTVYYHLIASDTVDRVVYNALANRKNVIETIMAERKASKEAATA